MLLLGVFLISFTSALEFDNTYTYDPIAREATFYNTFLGFKTSEIGKARLDTSLNVKVGGTGYKNVGNFTLCSFEDYNDALKKIKVKDMKTDNDIEQEADYLIIDQYKTEQRLVYTSSCEDVWSEINNTYVQECVSIVDYYEDVEVAVYKKLTPADLKKGCKQVQIWTNVEVGDHKDWRPTIYGVEVPEWSTWTQSLNVDLISYYKADDNLATTNIIDSLGVNDGTATFNTNANSVAGKINLSLDFDGATDYIDLNDVGDFNFITTDNFSFSFWIKPDVWTNGLRILSNDDASNGYQLIEATGDKVQFWGNGGSTVISTDTINVGSWNHIVITFQGGSTKIYINNGTAFTGSTTIATSSNDLHIAKDPSGAIGYEGVFDEFGVWNRTISGSEVSQIYNNFSAITWTDVFDQPPTIILNSPSSANYTSPQNITINLTASDDSNLSDVKLYVNTVLNQTNASGINDTDYLFDLVLSDGDYTIYGKATDNESQSTDSSSIRIVINTTPFIGFLTPPTLPNYANVSQSYVPIKVNVSTSVFKNITYSLRDINGTNYTQFYTTQTYDINFTSVPDGHYHYDVTVCTTTNKCNSTETRHINHDVAAPTINLTSPSGIFDFLIEGYDLDLNWTVSDEADNLNSCWYTYPSSFNVNFNETNIVRGSGAIASESIFDSWLYDNEYFIKTIGSQDSRYEAESFFSIENVLGDSSMPIYLNIGNWQDAAASANDPSWVEEFNLSFYNYDTESYDIIDSNTQYTNPGTGWTYVDINYTDSSIDAKYRSGNLLKVKIYIKRHDSNPSAYAASAKFELNYSNINQIKLINSIFLNCSLNTTTFNYSAFKNSLVFYSNDTFGNEGNETISWGYLILQTNQTYDSQVTEGTPNTITTFLNVVGDTISSAILSYNGTNYTTSLDYNSGNYTMASTVVAPLVAADTNITFQLFITISGTEYSTPATTQLIQAINFSTCTTGDKLLNIFLLDEEHKTELFGTIEINAGLVSKISGEAIESVLEEINNTSNLSICLDPISAVDNFYLDADIVYSSSDYAKEFYFMRNADLSAIPINLSLFDLNLSSSTEFLLRYQGQNLIKVEGAIIQLQRYYVSSGASETVEAPLTSISGTAIAHIDLNTVKYSATVVKDGVILDIFSDIVFDCENELSGQCTQNLYADVDPYNIIDGATLNDFSYAISDTGDKLVTTFSIPSGSTSSVNIVMTQRDQFGDTTSCNRTVTTSSGSLECDYNKTIGDSYLKLEINKDGEPQAQKEYFVPEANGIEWDGLNWLFLFGLLISVSLMAISSPEWIIGNSVIVLIIGGALWMADGLNIVAGLGLILWVIVAAVILILEMANKEDR